MTDRTFLAATRRLKTTKDASKPTEDAPYRHCPDSVAVSSSASASESVSVDDVYVFVPDWKAADDAIHGVLTELRNFQSTEREGERVEERERDPSEDRHVTE